MKKIFLLIVGLFGLILSGCEGTTQVLTQPGTGTIPAVISGQQTTGTQINTGNQSSIIPSRDYMVKLPDTRGSLTFSLNKGDSITLLVKQPSAKSVLRVNQIITPDGQADGPFSSDTTYIVTQSGMHTFIIGANLMASEQPYTGSVVVNVTLDLKK